MNRFVSFIENVVKWFCKSKIVRTKPYSDFFPKWFWNNRWSFLYCFCSIIFWTSVVVLSNFDKIDFSKFFDKQTHQEGLQGPYSDSLSKNFKKQLTPDTKSNNIKK